jgi:hypothetical protein
MSESQYGVRVATSKSGSVYIAGLYGKDGVAQKLKKMGLERNEFQKWVKQAAIIVAQRATHLAPRDTGRLALSIRGYSGKKITPNNQPARFLFGGVVVSGPKLPGKSETYGKAVSLGRYYKNISSSTVNSLSRRKSLTTFSNLETKTTNGRTKGNPYMRTARNQTRDSVVKMWNKEIGRWIEKNGFDTTGFGG